MGGVGGTGGRSRWGGGQLGEVSGVGGASRRNGWGLVGGVSGTGGWSLLEELVRGVGGEWRSKWCL